MRGSMAGSRMSMTAGLSCVTQGSWQAHLVVSTMQITYEGAHGIAPGNLYMMFAHWYACSA